MLTRSASSVQSLQFVHSHDALQAHSAAIWGAAVTSTDDVLSTSLDGTLALHSSSTNASSSGAPGTRLRTWPTRPLAWVSLSVASSATDGSDGAVGRRALVNSISGNTMLVDFTTGDELGTKNIGEKEAGPGTSDGWAEPAWSVSLSSDGRTYASTGASSGLTIHSALPSSSTSIDEGEAFGTRLSYVPTGRSKFGLFVQHSPVDPNRVAMSNEGGQVFIIDVTGEKVVQSWATHAMPVRSLAWSGDGDLLMSASDDRRLVLHDSRASTTSSSAVASLSGHTASVLSVALTPGDGRLALSGSRDGTVRVWDIGARKAVGVVREGGAVFAVKWRPISGAAKAAEDDASMQVIEGGIGGSGAGGFISGGEEGVVRWYRGAGMV